MSIRYILGRAGAGKSHLVLQEIKNRLDAGKPEDKLILIVPDQFTLQAERDLIEKLNLPGFIQVEVLSFTRLAHKVFNEVGGLTRVHINEQGKNMVLRRIIDETGKELEVYQNVSQQDGFVVKFSQLLCELKQYDITPIELMTGLNDLEEGSLLRKKLGDIAFIYEKFNSYLKDRYIDTEDSINHLITKMGEAGFIKDAEIWIDGFDSFTPQTCRIIEKLIQQAKKVHISFAVDFRSDGRDGDLFDIHKRSLAEIQKMAQKLGVPEEISDLGQNRSKSPIPEWRSHEIAHIEKEFYSYPYHGFTQEIRNLELFAGTSLYTEIENVAAQMVSMVRDRNYRWKDMAVICNDMDSYGSLISRVFEEYGIPCFMDRKRSIMNNPIIELILSCLSIIARGYRYEDVFRFLKTGFANLSIDEIELLENYSLEYGVRGNHWKHELALGQEQYPLEELNEARIRFVQPMIELERKVKGKKTFDEMTRALYDYLQSIQVHEQLELWIEELKGKGLYEYVHENAQIWNIVMEIFDQMVEILGDQEISLKEYIRVLESGFASLELGIIPTTMDQVLVGNIQRSKSHDIKALFVVGCNDGILPSGNGEEGILGDEERDILKENGLYMGGDGESHSIEEKYGIYSAFSKPREYLWVSYALADQEGKAMRPSILIDRFKKLFRDLEIKSDVLTDEQRQLHLVATPNSTFKYLIENIRSHIDQKPMQDFWWDVYQWYCDHSEWDGKRQAVIEGFFHKNQESPIGNAKARQLYRVPIRSSISRLEQFANCPFAHFVRYGLRPAERKTFTVEAPDMGELFHNSIERFTEHLREEKLDWRQLDEERCDALMDQVMDEMVPSHSNGVLLSTHRYRYLVNRLKRISRRAIWTLTDHIKRGGFEPLGHEVSFGIRGYYPPIEIQLPDGEKAYLEGRIDRVDILEEEDCRYVKIIDYKSGSEDFDLSSVYYGLKLQLMVYLDAILTHNVRQDGKGIKPAGIFYFKIDDPLVDTHEKIVEEIQKEIRKKLKMKGLAIKDARIVREIDSQIDGYSDVLPLGISKNDSFYANSSVVGEEEFGALIRHVQGLVREISAEIIRGNIRIHPVKNGKRTACDYCSFTGVCQFDKLFDENDYRYIRGMKAEEILKKITAAKEGEEHAQMD